MTDMKIDILLPTYNRRDYLMQAIASIRAQSFRDWRLLIVNDGGEEVGDDIADLNDDRLVYFSRPHAGKAVQLNFALGESTAPYVAYMDDDDIVFPNHLERLLYAAERLGSDFVYSDTYQTVLDSEGRVVHRSVENEKDAPYDEIRIFNRINHKQILHARELVNRAGGYDDQMRILIDFDGIKRLIHAAKRPFHLREITGEHFLRLEARGGGISSISGLWKKDPAAAGRSLLRFFEKDPEALAVLYNRQNELEGELIRLRKKADRRLSIRLKRLFSRGKESRPGEFFDALPLEGVWRDAAPSVSLREFFLFSDESNPAIEAVNRIAAGEHTANTRRTAFNPRAIPCVVPQPHFSMLSVDRGIRFIYPPGTADRWVTLMSLAELPRDFALSFDYIPHAVFQEQFQFNWRMTSLGSRLRFMVRENSRLVANAVEEGRFCPDSRQTSFTFALNRSYSIRIESRGGVCSFIVDGRNLLSLKYAGPIRDGNGHVALIFYEASVERAIDFEIRNFSYSLPQ